MTQQIGPQFRFRNHRLLRRRRRFARLALALTFLGQRLLRVCLVVVVVVVVVVAVVPWVCLVVVVVAVSWTGRRSGGQSKQHKGSFGVQEVSRISLIVTPRIACEFFLDVLTTRCNPQWILTMLDE